MTILITEQFTSKTPKFRPKQYLALADKTN